MKKKLNSKDNGNSITMIHQPYSKIILASASPRRRQLLQQIKWNFIVDPSQADEVNDVPDEPEAHVIELSRRKAEEVGQKYSDGVIIGADTIVYHENQILGKPKDHDHAVELLERLSGVFHHVFTGITIIDAKSEKFVSGFEKTAVKFRDLTSSEIEDYVATGEPMDKAGAYGIQEYGALLVERVEGCYFNVVGLPLVRLMRLLQELSLRN